jgi:hypothetical protein
MKKNILFDGLHELAKPLFLQLKLAINMQLKSRVMQN